jgi:hypothetical protein
MVFIFIMASVPSLKKNNLFPLPMARPSAGSHREPGPREDRNTSSDEF